MNLPQFWTSASDVISLGLGWEENPQTQPFPELPNWAGPFGGAEMGQDDYKKAAREPGGFLR